MKKTKLPFFGVGPVYVGVCMLLTIGGLILNETGFLESGNLSNIKHESLIVGTLMIVFGCGIWIYTVFIQKIFLEIKRENLVTSGIYSIVRNPIYSAFFLIFTGILITAHNVYLLVLPVVFYVFLTILMKRTEEKWLLEKFGSSYIEYCKKVNRVIPWWRH